MAAAASDRISDLPDDVLIHVLSFLPSKEAARSTGLSRRWRCPLWLDTAVVNLDSRSYTAAGTGSAAIDADHAFSLQHLHGRVPSKVTLVLHDDSMHDDVLRAACRDKGAVEELRLDCTDGGWPPCWKYSCREDSCGSCSQSFLPMYPLPPTLLPFAALRVLDLNGCHLKDVVQFPCMAALRLRLCSMERATLQDMVSSAPVLADLRLESLSFTGKWSFGNLHLRCPSVTSIAMTNMAARDWDHCTVAIDAPCLRCFCYTQHLWFSDFGSQEVSFYSPQPTGLERVTIDVRSPALPLCSILGRCECHTTVLKLSVFSIADVVDRTGILPNFPNLERLEIEELCGFLDDRVAAARAIMDMLHCCPAIRDLRLKFIFLDKTSIDPADHVAAMSELTPCKSPSEDGGSCCKVSYFPRSPPAEWLMDRWQKSLKKVAVRCDVEELTCFQVQLVSFMARNAESLEEVDIISAGRNPYIHRKVEEWRATPWTEGSLAERYIHPKVEEWGATIWHRRPIRQPALRLSSFPPLPSRR